ncbi:unnamed protein product [Parajaminaea phylloscopi]
MRRSESAHHRLRLPASKTDPSHHHPMRLRQTAVGVGCLVAASAVPLAESRNLPQQPFAAPSRSAYAGDGGASAPPPLPSDLALHRFCLPGPQSRNHMPDVLVSLSDLSRTNPELELDFWSLPRTIAGSAGEERSCIDFTYPDQDEANNLLDAVTRKSPEGVELFWSKLVNGSELSTRIEQQTVRQPQTGADAEGTGTADPFHNRYHSLSDITAFLSWHVSQQPEIAELVELGTSHENNVIQGIRLGRKGSDSDQQRRQVVIAAGAHGREWVTTSVALFLVSHLLQNPAILDKTSVLIVPVLNPDGYLYTWTSDRFFRKNRQPVDSKDWLGRQCYGVDVSRNFPTNFRSSAGSNSGCSPTYGGDEPLTTAESKALADYLTSEQHGVVAFLDLHSYGQMLLYPWLSCSVNDSEDDSIPDEEDMSELTLGAARAAKLVHNHPYRSGRGCDTMYSQEGSTVDFSYSEVGIKWSLELELRDEGSYGFLLPPDQIRPTGEEAAAIVDYWLAFVAKRERL